MSSMNLNLARKWRSKDFDTIVGQALSCKMLKNSLYLDQYFPVYLFSGQRGCGKTTTARVFAAAINCQNRMGFQKNPKKNSVPCLTCDSCTAMLEGRHPDFIEIDAASHTGVDNVRSIIESASFLPVMGNKKLYLIDEAHMLSKASFNALLKILEEPPPSVLFILATTDPHKIIDTVTSRCFQLFFTPVGERDLLQHLKNVCTQEAITYDEAGLKAVIQAADGSVRDALNVVERARFSHGAITQKNVLALLGHLDDEQAVHLFEIILGQKPQDLIAFFKKLNLTRFSASAVWFKLVDLVRAALWVSYGAQPEHFSVYSQRLGTLVAGSSAQRLHAIASLLYEQEQYFVRTSAQHELLEMVLLRICQENSDNNSSGGSGASAAPSVTSSEGSCSEGDELQDEEDEEPEDDDAVASRSASEKSEGASDRTMWQAFLADLKDADQALLISIFSQASIACEHSLDRLSVTFPKNLAFFDDWLNETTSVWKPRLQKIFGEAVAVQTAFTGQETKEPPKLERAARDKRNEKVSSEVEKKTPRELQSMRSKNTSQAKKYNSYRSNGSSRGKMLAVNESSAKERAIDVSDAATWERTALVLQQFPGVVTELVVEGEITHSMEPSMAGAPLRAQAAASVMREMI